MQAKLELHDQIQEEDQFTRIARQSAAEPNIEQQHVSQDQQKQRREQIESGHPPSNHRQSLVADHCYQIVPSSVAPPVSVAPTLKLLPLPLDVREGVSLDTKSTTTVHQHEIGSRQSTLSPPPSTPFTSYPSQKVAEKPQTYLNPSFPLLPTPSSAWRCRLSKPRSLTTMTGSVKRSLSTPNVQQAAAAMADGTGVMPYSTDKRRNKLGYHRTSVACGHCRRRKIRCLLAKDDPHGRCSNCIRLKKECNFYPVEGTDRRPRSLSKPDISTQDTGSSASSPSPGMGQLPRSDAPAGYPVSVPATPTYNSGPFDDSMCHGSLSSASGRLSATHSTTVSRRPSLAQLHALPLNVKPEQGYLTHRDGFPRPVWELASQIDPSTRFSDQQRTGLEDPSTAFWRLTSSSPMISTFSSQQSLGSITPLNSADSPERDDRSWHSQAPSRMGSVDQGMGNGFPYNSAYSSDADTYSGASEMYSASVSTVSLAASIPDNSQYSSESRNPAPFYMSQWADQAGITNNYDMDNAPIKQETFESQTSFYPEDGHYEHVDNSPLIFHSALQSPAAVGIAHM